MCMRKYDIWLLVFALLGSSLIFERRSELEIKSGEIVANRVSYWGIKHEIKKINVAEVGNVGVRSKRVSRGSYLPELFVYTKQGELFYTMVYNNGFTAKGRSEKDVYELKKALVRGNGFSISRNESGLWVVLVIAALLAYICRRNSWHSRTGQQGGIISQ